jgi:hypothetical protein
MFVSKCCLMALIFVIFFCFKYFGHCLMMSVKLLLLLLFVFLSPFKLCSCYIIHLNECLIVKRLVILLIIRVVSIYIECAQFTYIKVFNGLVFVQKSFRLKLFNFNVFILLFIFVSLVDCSLVFVFTILALWVFWFLGGSFVFETYFQHP